MFQRLFNPEGKLFIWGNKACDMILASVLWLLCCIPLITIGPACTALYHVIVHNVRGDQGNLIQTFFRVFTAEFRMSAAMMLVYTAVAAAALLGAMAYVQSGGSPNDLTAWLLKALLFPVLLSAPYGFAFLSRFRNGFWKSMGLVLFLGFRHLPASLGLIALLGAGSFLVYLQLPLVVFMPGLVCLCMSFLIEPVFHRYMPAEPVPQTAAAD